MFSIRNVRGTKDLFRNKVDLYDKIISIASHIAKNYLYERVEVPIIEYSDIFTTSLGEDSDILSKEIYMFKDKSDNILALRPEFTASIVRACISNGWKQYLPLKLFTHGPVFRYDRPQAGRQRQFNQINFEHLKSETPYCDAEIIKLAEDLSMGLGIRDDLTIEVNSLGSDESRSIYTSQLKEYFLKYKSSLSEDSKKRLYKNPLRILDSKDKSDIDICYNSPKINDCYSYDDKKYFELVQNHLTLFDIKYKINSRLVRGLDYYSHTTFEFVTNNENSQNTVIAGGRYNGLFKKFGYKDDINSIGFAGGIERIMLLSDISINKTRPVVIIVLNSDSTSFAINLLNTLRNRNVVSALEESQNTISKQINNAIKLNAKYVIFIGEDEEKHNNYKVKNLDSREEYFYSSIDDLLYGLDDNCL